LSGDRFSYFLFGDTGGGGVVESSVVPGNSSSKFIWGGDSSFVEDRLVVNPIHLPRKITLIHNVKEMTAAVFAAAGGDGEVSHWRVVRPQVISKIPILIPDNSKSAIFA
jgi:hypothetical protein